MCSTQKLNFLLKESFYEQKNLLSVLILLGNSVAYSSSTNFPFYAIMKDLLTDDPKIFIVDYWRSDEVGKCEDKRECKEKENVIARLGRRFPARNVWLERKDSKCSLEGLIAYAKLGRQGLVNQNDEELAREYIAHFFNGDPTLKDFSFTFCAATISIPYDITKNLARFTHENSIEEAQAALE